MPEDRNRAVSIGADLRALRRARKLTLQAVASRLGRSLGWLSQVERDISSPSITELRRFAGLYGVPLSLFFGTAKAPAEEAGRVVRQGARRVISDPGTGLHEELLSPDLGDDFEVVRSTFAPRAALREAFRRATTEIVYLVSGRLIIWLDGERFEIAAGDSFRIRGESTRWENPDDTPAVAIWAISPPIY
ncbi:MAG: helix-turn-helix domain-containing protein [Pararhodobacter sp.]|nr:helix-turn-helix domain-containing protein [Pararhodobacter sp.]